MIGAASVRAMKPNFSGVSGPVAFVVAVAAGVAAPALTAQAVLEDIGPD